jgi:hypothetical protein
VIGAGGTIEKNGRLTKTHKIIIFFLHENHLDDADTMWMVVACEKNNGE